MVAIAACVNHPEREALGVCVRCRMRVCSECVTKVDGINYCVTCLAILAVEGSVSDSIAAGGAVGAWVRLGVGVALLVAMTWGLLSALLPGVA